MDSHLTYSRQYILTFPDERDNQQFDYFGNVLDAAAALPDRDYADSSIKVQAWDTLEHPKGKVLWLLRANIPVKAAHNGGYGREVGMLARLDKDEQRVLAFVTGDTDFTPQVDNPAQCG